MKLYFLRHGEAEPGLADDAARRLTEKGIARLDVAAQVMQRLDMNPQVIYSSPRIRAQQTAEIVAEAFGLSVEIRKEVNFSFSVDAVERLIVPLPEDAEVMFVGHEPSMSTTISDLTGADVVMKKGGLARVDIVQFAPPLEGQLIWLIPPKVFEALGD